VRGRVEKPRQRRSLYRGVGERAGGGEVGAEEEVDSTRELLTSRHVSHQELPGIPPRDAESTSLDR
jgi:hypothetical protein